MEHRCPTEFIGLGHQISGAGHWFLERWIGVDFLVDSGSAVTAVSGAFYKTLMGAGAPVGELRPTTRRLRGANGSQIDILVCSFCVVSFLGLRTEFPILVCGCYHWNIYLGINITTHTGHQSINMDCCLQKEACPFSYTAGMLHYPDVCLPWNIA